ncbi:MAG: SUMF1/EgtB/PvdO family nonheme iron enzyme [Planctomycetota bacterium]|nr:SUMF1/EgtB/PvdO family nonheme iron enzyme [Planctomycetota bacterium]
MPNAPHRPPTVSSVSPRVPAILLGLLGLLLALGNPACARADDAAYLARRDAMLPGYAKRELKFGVNPLIWVDTERWCVAHAALTLDTRLEDANKYLSEVVGVSLSHGLVADIDVQVTDLLRTYLQFKDSPRLTPAAKERLLRFFREWVVPNQDRNRTADTTYEWPGEYTENHSLNILTGAYLIDVALNRDRKLHRELLERFLADRARWGWSEFHSPSYAIVTAKALVCLNDFAPDKNIATAAKMTLDILAIEFANHGLNTWRGVPFLRGLKREVDNTSNSFYPLARLLFGDKTDPKHEASDPCLVHLLTSSYRPPEVAVAMLADPVQRGKYLMQAVLTTGPDRLRVPTAVWVTPNLTVASALGAGHYYGGCYWSISFASAPQNVITGNYDVDRNIVQRKNVLATFGSVTWNGPGLKKTTEGNITIGGDGKAMIGQIDLAEDCHLFLAADPGDYATPAEFKVALTMMQATFADGVLSWTMPDGKKIRCVNRRDGKRWAVEQVFEDDKLVRLDTDMLYATPWLQSVRDSKVIEVLWAGKKQVYDFRDIAKPAVRSESGPLTKLPDEEIDGTLGIKLLYIPPGQFPMGSSAAEGREHERPQRWVDVDGYYISRTEVTFGQYKPFLAENPSAAKLPEWFAKEWGKTDEYPMTWVSWDEAKAFCAWLSKKTGKKFDLPTEAQWEKACKGYSHRIYPWGATYHGTESGTPNETYLPVANKPTDISPFGVLDMAGNAWEWCNDYYDPKAYSTQPDANPLGPEKGTLRVLRGSGWNFDPDTFRCSYRTRSEPGLKSVHVGFRVVRVP